MPLNILFAFFIAFVFGALAFGPLWGGILAVIASAVTIYWDKISNWVHTKLDKWETEL